MKSFVRTAAAALAGAVLVAGAAFALPRAQDAKPAAAPAGQEKKSEVIVPFFGNEVCPTTGKPVNKTKFVESGGQKVYFCCNNCLAKAKADPKAALAAAYKEPKAVANKTCPVSGKAIEAGKGKEVIFETKKVTLCCGDCEAEFNKNPFLYTAVAVYGATDLKNKKCPVMDDEESTTENLVIYKGKIVRMCCDDCHEDFAKDPEKLLAKASGH